MGQDRWYHEYPMALRITAGAVVIGGLGMTFAIWYSFDSVFSALLFFFMFSIVSSVIVFKHHEKKEALARAKEAQQSGKAGGSGGGPIRMRSNRASDLDKGDSEGQ